MLTVTIDQSEGISGADIPEKAVKKMRTGSAALSLPSPARFSHFLLLNDFPPPSRSLEQARVEFAVCSLVGSKRIFPAGYFFASLLKTIF